MSLVLRHWLVGLLYEAFVFPELEQSGFAEFIEFDLFDKHIQRYIDRSAEFSAALVVVKYGLEAKAVPVEEVLVLDRVEVPARNRMLVWFR